MGLGLEGAAVAAAPVRQSHLAEPMALLLLLFLLLLLSLLLLLLLCLPLLLLLLLLFSRNQLAVHRGYI